MTSILAVTTAATDKTLLTIEELRAAAGLASGDTSQDARLTTLGARVAAAIARACRVRSGGIAPPTLRAETLTESFRPAAPLGELLLSRRPISTITSITIDGVALTADQYERDDAAAILYREEGGRRTCWPCSKIVVVYVAGWATVPDDLQLAASKLAGIYYFSDGADPNLRSEELPDVYRVTYGRPGDNGAGGDQVLPAEIEALLGPYRMFWL